jgi:hypothetical protein
MVGGRAGPANTILKSQIRFANVSPPVGASAGGPAPQVRQEAGGRLVLLLLLPILILVRHPALHFLQQVRARRQHQAGPELRPACAPWPPLAGFKRIVEPGEELAVLGRALLGAAVTSEQELPK